jgi:hypothetical protein
MSDNEGSLLWKTFGLISQVNSAYIQLYFPDKYLGFVTLRGVFWPLLWMFFRGATVRNSPGTHYRDFRITLSTKSCNMITLSDSVGLLWKSDQPDAESSTWHDTTLPQNIQVSGRIRTHNPRKRANAVPRLRPRGHWPLVKQREKFISVNTTS